MKKNLLLKYFSLALFPALVLIALNFFSPGFLPENTVAAAALAFVLALAAALLIYTGEKSGSSEILTLFKGLQKEKKELQEIISSIREPIMVADSKGIIIMANRAFKKLSGISGPVGRHFSAVINSSEFKEFLDKVVSRKESSSTSIGINDCFYFISASYLDTGKEVSVLFQDITQLKNLEKIKRDFVSNVSHELKTPLTAIKGFTATLEEEIDKKNRHYLNIIKRHTERLINIVHDLLILSELEEKDVLEISVFSIREMIADMLRMFQAEARDKGIEIKTAVDSNLDKVAADRVKIEQLLINLTANAIKYTEEGEVTIKALREKNDLLISVSDTGIGIKEKYVPRIFERFYRVSKSRSRESGGTGLGLAIVKHIALQHKGDVHARSISGKGTVFSVRFPRVVRDE